MKRTQLSLALLVLAGLALAVQGCGKVNRTPVTAPAAKADTNGGGPTPPAAGETVDISYSCELPAGKMNVLLDGTKKELWLLGASEKKDDWVAKSFPKPFEFDKDDNQPIQFAIFEVSGDDDGINGTWNLYEGAAQIKNEIKRVGAEEFLAASSWGGFQGKEIAMKFEIVMDEAKTSGKGTVTLRGQAKAEGDTQFRPCEVTSEATVKAITLPSLAGLPETVKAAFELETKFNKKEFTVKVPKK